MSEIVKNRKYEVTDIAHPEYPWLHRIRALRDVGMDVSKGDLGGYVQTEGNLAQVAECWVYDDAIVCENAAVMQAAQVRDSAVVRGCALVSGSAVARDKAVVEDLAIMMNGTVCEKAHISGSANIGQNLHTSLSPVISGSAAVYGEVRGNVVIREEAVILPGVKIDLPTTDTLCIETANTGIIRDADRKANRLTPPKEYEQPAEKPNHCPQER